VKVEKLTTVNVYFLITEVCTLKCKLCSAGMPYYKNSKPVPYEQIIKDIDSIFEIYKYVEKVDISGGEPLTHPDVNKIFLHMLKYKNQIGSLRLITNGTLVPNKELIQIFSKNNVEIILDDYGAVSVKKEEIINLAKENNLRLRVNVYSGDSQFCDGWVDLGDLNHRNSTELEDEEKFNNCFIGQHMCLTVKNGKLYQCARSILIEEFTQNGNDFEHIVDLSENISVEEKIKKAMKFGKERIKACSYCNGFDPQKSKRYSAAEQLK